jgi:hypothetical protein
VAKSILFIETSETQIFLSDREENKERESTQNIQTPKRNDGNVPIFITRFKSIINAFNIALKPGAGGSCL